MKLLFIAVICIAYILLGIYFEAESEIRTPAGWSFYGAIFGFAIGCIVAS